MKKAGSKALALVLALIMALATMAPAFAATVNDAYVRVVSDGKETYASSRNGSGTVTLLDSGVRAPDSIQVNGVEFVADGIGATQGAAKWVKLDSKTNIGQYKIYWSGAALKMDWTALTSSLLVEMTTKQHDDYVVTANALPNTAASINVEPTTTVEAGRDYTVLFTLVSDKQEFRTLTVKVGSVSKDLSVPLKDTKTETVGGQEITLGLTAGGKLQVTAKTVTADMNLTAQVYNKTVRYDLLVETDGRCTSDITNECVVEKTSKVITFKPEDGRSIGDIEITDGEKTGTIKAGESSASVNGKTYGIVRNLDNTVRLTVPAMTADVLVYAQTTDKGHFVRVDTSWNISTLTPGVNYVPDDSSFAVTFTRLRDVTGLMFKITTSKGVYTADAEDNYILVEGRYLPIYRNVKGEATLHVNKVWTNMYIQAVARDASHVVNVSTDAKVRTDVSSRFIVADGDDYVMTFTPVDGYAVRTIRVTANGTTSSIDPTTARTIRVDGNTWDVRTGANGVVTVYAHGILSDVSVYASAVRNATSADRTFSLSRSTDGHSSVSFSSGSPVYAGESVTARVYTDNDYVIKSVAFTMNGKTATVEPFASSFRLDGETYQVKWLSNAEMSVTFPAVYANLAVRAVSEKGAEKLPSGSDGGNTPTGAFRVTTTAGSHSNLALSGENPFYAGEQVVITATADRGYVLNNIKLVLGGSSATIAPFDTSFVLNNRTYSVYWTSNRDVRIVVDSLSGNLSVSTVAAQGDEVLYNGGVPGSGEQPGEMLPSGVHAGFMFGNGDGTFAPDRAMSRAEAITVLCRLYGKNVDLGQYAGKTGYADVPAAYWGAGYIGYAKTMGYLNALYGGMTNFEPNRAITRAEFVVLLCSFTNQNLTGVSMDAKYSDTANHWAAAYINYATQRGWVNGKGNNMFGPDESLTRAEICAMMNRITNRLPGGHVNGATVNFYDVPVNHWAYADIMEAANTHVVAGVVDYVEVWAK